MNEVGAHDGFIRNSDASMTFGFMTHARAFLQHAVDVRCVVAGLILVLECASPSAAQMIVRRSGGAEAGQKNGFSIKKEDPAVADALGDFDRYCAKGAWEKAFGAIEKVAAVPSKGLIAVDDNFYLPTRVRLRQALIALPPAGRQAYRLFNDAKAKQMLDQLESPSADIDGPRDDLAKLQDLYDRFFITSIGDQIADRLGDALFEAGDFGGAASAWQSILTDYPDSALSPLRIRAKRAIALARDRRTSELTSAITEMRDKFPGEHVRFGGADVDVAALSTALISVNEPTTAPTGAPPDAGPESLAEGLSLPASDEPMWQCCFADEAFFKQIQSLMNNGNWYYMRKNYSAVVPSSATDGRRVFMNWFGIAICVDVETGKLLWRSAPFKEVANKLQRSMMNGMGAGGGDDDAVVALPGRDRVLFVREDLEATQRAMQRGQAGGGARLSCLDANTGKPAWSSASGPLSAWQFSGAPVIAGDTIYATARGGNAGEMSLVAISIDDGKFLWSAPLGTATAKQDPRGFGIAPTPVAKLAGGTMYILTSNGALLAVDLHTRRVAWAFTYETPAPPTGEYYYDMPRTEVEHFPSTMEIVGSTLFIKEKDNATAYAIDLSTRTLKWQRRVDANAMLVAADSTASRVFVLSDGLGCIDVVSRDLKWSTKLPVGTGDARPLIAGLHAYLFGNRGVYDVKLQTGERTIFRGADRESVGGTLYRVGDRLICISNRAVTAYPLGPNGKEPTK